jgi:hypothetical protein
VQNLQKVEERNEVVLFGNNLLVFGASKLNPAANRALDVAVGIEFVSGGD